ncbi:hypothetical protein CEUSTIGMA_g12349.t1 [Chlamydomonas eustigma]|uniref:RING-type domain-containing protein n=1 Tax=Chlamydomonas eustigma TaxID=1157962 RepID=A0A250XPE5_9CHLO|nr:hypothetical protein CEUSTIGMA_g12349.t1 [Chlamydomonas eustigma]|eukprot:GAX84928.1 hypothetical protein CEUSTIGMA_g12349.t1 [Chlamydomonas eustigma]
METVVYSSRRPDVSQPARSLRSSALESGPGISAARSTASRGAVPSSNNNQAAVNSSIISRTTAPGRSGAALNPSAPQAIARTTGTQRGSNTSVTAVISATATDAGAMTGRLRPSNISRVPSISQRTGTTAGPTPNGTAVGSGNAASTVITRLRQGAPTSTSAALQPTPATAAAALSTTGRTGGGYGPPAAAAARSSTRPMLTTSGSSANRSSQQPGPTNTATSTNNRPSIRDTRTLSTSSSAPAPPATSRNTTFSRTSPLTGNQSSTGDGGLARSISNVNSRVQAGSASNSANNVGQSGSAVLRSVIEASLIFPSGSNNDTSPTSPQPGASNSPTSSPHWHANSASLAAMNNQIECPSGLPHPGSSSSSSTNNHGSGGEGINDLRGRIRGVAGGLTAVHSSSAIAPPSARSTAVEEALSSGSGSRSNAYLEATRRRNSGRAASLSVPTASSDSVWGGSMATALAAAGINPIGGVAAASSSNASRTFSQGTAARGTAAIDGNLSRQAPVPLSSAAATSSSLLEHSASGAARGALAASLGRLNAAANAASASLTSGTSLFPPAPPSQTASSSNPASHNVSSSSLRRRRLISPAQDAESSSSSSSSSSSEEDDGAGRIRARSSTRDQQGLGSSSSSTMYSRGTTTSNTTAGTVTTGQAAGSGASSSASNSDAGPASSTRSRSLPEALARLDEARENLRAGLERREMDRSMMLRSVLGGGGGDHLLEEMQLALAISLSIQEAQREREAAASNSYRFRSSSNSLPGALGGLLSALTGGGMFPSGSRDDDENASAAGGDGTGTATVIRRPMVFFDNMSGGFGVAMTGPGNSISMLPMRALLGNRGAGEGGGRGGMFGMTYESLQSLEDVRVHAPKEVVDGLKTSIFKTGGSVDGTCSICQLDYDAGDKIAHLPCSHTYHHACVAQWLGSYSKKCPVCKGEVC